MPRVVMVYYGWSPLPEIHPVVTVCRGLFSDTVALVLLSVDVSLPLSSCLVWSHRPELTHASSGPFGKEIRRH